MKIINYINKQFFTIITNNIRYIAVFSLLLNLILVSFYFLHTTPGTDLNLPSTSIGPDLISEQAWKEYTETVDHLVTQLVFSTEHYGLINEHKMDYAARQLIINYPNWLDYYRKYRLKIWNGFENQRLADDKTFPDYQSETSELIAQAISTQGC